MSLWQSILVGMTMALVEMRSHPLRSALSMLGVMLGVASLVSMLTLIGGIDVFFSDRMGKWAGSVVFAPRAPGPKTSASWSRSPGMRLSDGAYLDDESDVVKQFHASIERTGRVTIAGYGEQARIRGIDGAQMDEELTDVYLAQGRGFSPAELSGAAPVCLVTWEVDERVRAQPGAPASLVGRRCRFQSADLTVIGIVRPRDPAFKPWNLRATVIVPISTMQRLVTGGDPNPGTLRVSVRDPKLIHTQARQVARDLAQRHRGVEDFEYQTTEWIREVTRMLDNAGRLMSIVAAVSLLVGGLSIMNVMLSSIAERIHEIGVRKALGARSSQIFVQFLAETVTLCLFGGAAGSLAGLLPLAFKTAIKSSTQGAIEPTILPLHIVWVAGIVTAVGILFGLYPAFKALRMDPVDALRYE